MISEQSAEYPGENHKRKTLNFGRQMVPAYEILFIPLFSKKTDHSCKFENTHMSITTNKWDKEKQKGISTWKPKGETDVVL